MTTPSVDSEWERFLAWCRREAIGIRARAAAFGTSAEHEYLRGQARLRSALLNEFPDRSVSDVLHMERDCYDDALTVSLEEINRLRAKEDYPPLTEVPHVQGRTHFVAPMPPVPGREEQLAAFAVWEREKAREVHEDAMVYGVSVKEALADRLPRYIEAIQRNFPALKVPGSVSRLLREVPWLKPEKFDEESIRQRREVFGTFMKVGQEIERLAEQDPSEDLKN